MNFKKLFEEETGFEIKENRYLKPHDLPYFLFKNTITKRGSDTKLFIQENDILIERYSLTNNKEDLEQIKKIKNFLEKFDYEYEVNTEWLNNEKLYGTYWDLDPIVEKINNERK